MEFSVQLSSDYPDKSYGGERVYRDMIEQAVLADRLGFDAVSITEHHLVNCLMMPAPLTFAVKLAAHTQQVKILTCVTGTYLLRIFIPRNFFPERKKFNQPLQNIRYNKFA